MDFAKAVVTMELACVAMAISAVAQSRSGPAAPEAKAFDPFAERWVHASPTSAVVYWQTGAEARDVETAGKGWIEYGTAGEFEKKTVPYSLPPVCDKVPEGVRVFQKPSWSQFHRVTGLEPGKTYSFRMVYIGPDGKETKSEEMTLTTPRPKGAIALPGDLDGPPYVLDKPGATYVVTRDIAADGTAFQITANDVTLDLDGHKVVFGGKSPGKCAGIDCSYRSGGRVLNGIIEEGIEGGRRVPVWLYACKAVTVAGLGLRYRGKDGQGIALLYKADGSDIHHNEIYDEGFDTTSRHQQLHAIASMSAGTGAKFHHNIVLRCRQTGIGVGASEAKARQGNVVVRDFAIYNNMIYVGSCMTNSMGISAGGAVKGFRIHNNRILGRGEMPECIFVGTGANTGEVSSNYTFSRSTGKVSKEYGATSSLSSGLRLCWGPFRLDIHDNTFVTESGKTGEFAGNARCIWAACSDSRQPEWRTSGEIDVHDNEITALIDATGGGYARAITVCGDHKCSAHGLVFRDNKVTTNANAVVLSESYGCGSSDVAFSGNTFVKAPNAAKFVLITCGYWNKPTTGSRFVDSRFEGEASYEQVAFSGNAERNFSIGWTLTVRTAPFARLTVTDSTGKKVFSGAADDKGVVKAPLAQFLVTPRGRTEMTPHSVEVDVGGKTSEATVTMDKARELRIGL